MPLSPGSSAVAACVVVLALGGCGVTAVFGPSDDHLLETASLTDSDAAAGATFQPYENGDVVAGEDSLDLCHGSFPSERLRIGRNQVGIGDAAGRSWVSSEAILYSTPAEAKQAMGELKTARDACPTTPQRSPDRPDVAVTWRFGEDPATGWTEHSGVTRQGYAFTITGEEDDTAIESTAIYLQRGRMILALYSTPPDGPESVIVNSPDPQRFTEVMTQRLLALPEDALQQGDPDKRVRDPRDIGT